MKSSSSNIRSVLTSLLATITLLFSASMANAQTTLAKWTFDTLVVSGTYTNAAGSITNVPADSGAGTASGFHSQFSATQYSTPAGNGSAKALAASFWTNNPGDYWQFAVSTVNNQNITVIFDQTGSSSGPRDFSLRYSTDGINFTTWTNYSLPTPTIAWVATTGNPASTFTNDLSSVPALNNASTVYFRLVCNSSTNLGNINNGGMIGSTGTDRMDNFTVLAFNPGPLTLTKDLSNTNVFQGDTLTMSVAASGSSPITYQWYYPNLSTPLADGPSASGGTISGSTASSLNLTFISTNQAGNYQVIASNPTGSVTSQVAQVTVNIRPPIVTNIAYLHTLHNTNFVLTNTTDLFQVEGIVTTPANLVSGTGKSFFIQDATGGMDIFFRNSDFSFPAGGDHVRVTAQLEEFNGLLELHAVAANLSHKIEILDSGNPLPTPQFFTFATPLNPTNMEHFVEGSYVIISNVNLTVTNADGKMTAGSFVAVTNLTGQGFRLSVPSYILAEPVLQMLPGSPSQPPYTVFAASVKGMMTQADTSVIKTNGYSIYLSDRADITLPPPIIYLSIAKSGSDIQVSWPTNSSNFYLENTASLTTPINWLRPTQLPIETNGQNVVTFSNTTDTQFYRLKAP